MPELNSERLRLVPMELPFMQALLEGETERAARLGDFAVGPEPDLRPGLLKMRSKQLEEDPSLLPWLLHAVILKEENRMCGRAGFHTRPGPDYLGEIAPGGVELGYGIEGRYRRRGIAREAALMLMRWAFEEQRQRIFVLSISPTNEPSVAMARSLGFEIAGEWEDDEDGLEFVFVREVSAWPGDWRVPGASGRG